MLHLRSRVPFALDAAGEWGLQTREYVMKPLSQHPAESLFDQPAQR